MSVCNQKRPNLFIPQLGHLYFDLFFLTFFVFL